MKTGNIFAGKWIILLAILLAIFFVSPLSASRECDLKIKAHNHGPRVISVLSNKSKMRRKASPIFHRLRAGLRVSGASGEQSEAISDLKYNIGNLKSCKRGTLIFKLKIKCHRNATHPTAKIVETLYSSKVKDMPKINNISVMDFGNLAKYCN